LTKPRLTRTEIAGYIGDAFVHGDAGRERGGRMQIGTVAERTALSLRTIRYYEEAGLVAPSARTAGGFRLYTEADCERLQLIKQMKPLGFSLDEMRDLLHVLDQLAAGAEEAPRGALIERLHDFTQSAGERCDRLREQLAAATGFAGMLQQWLKHECLRGSGQ